MNPSPHVIVGWMILALCAVGLIWIIDHYRDWFRYQAVWGWTFCAEYVRAGRPEQRTVDEYAHDEAIAEQGDVFADMLEEARAEETQPFQAFHEDAPDGPVIPTARVGGVYLPLSEDVPRPDVKPPDQRPEGVLSTDAVPGYLPFQPHAGPPAWRPRHAKTSWVDELITEALGAPSVEHYMWNWQQRHRLAVTA